MPVRCCFVAWRCVVCHASGLPGSMAELNTSVGCRQSFSGFRFRGIEGKQAAVLYLAHAVDLSICALYRAILFAKADLRASTD